MMTPQEVEAYYANVGVTKHKPRGDWRDARCPFHEDSSPSFSFNVKTGAWVCRAGCGEGGMKEVAARTGIPFPRAPRPERVPASGGKTLVAAYDYRDEQGRLLFQALRYRTASGAKTFRQRQPGPEGAGWRWNLDGARLVIYRLPDVIAAPTDAPVFVVEGEKDADALTVLGLTATTSPMGAGKWRPDYAVHLEGRRVVVIPDNDRPGRAHAQAVAASLAGRATEVRVLTLPDLPEKGDVSDWLQRGGSREALEALAAQAPLWEPPRAPEAPGAAQDAPGARPGPGEGSEGTPGAARAARREPGAGDGASGSQEAANAPQEAPFEPLGYAEGTFFYLSRQTMQVTGLTAANHSKLHLLTLAPLEFWARAYATESGQIAWTAAASTLMQTCARRGVFEHSRIRGRGAWSDRGRPVVHLGDSIVVDGRRQALSAPEPGGYIYPAAAPIPIDFETPMPATEAAKLTALCEMLAWDRPINARFLAGWLAIAPICGALAWRPHIWVTGAAGTGKSWVMDNLMRPLLGRIGLFVQSDTTEAGIRQALGYDARPVLFDEAEGESERAQVRMQNVLALMRQSSSENGSVIVKGSTSGNVKVYCIRSCFAFSSIGVGIKQHSDSTRVTILSLVKHQGHEAEQRFAAIRAAAAAITGPDWVGSFHARMVSLIPTIRANAETFSRAAATYIGSQRMGDQAGALLAGAYALHSDHRISAERAYAWVAEQDWSEQTSVHESPDEVLCIQRILQHVVRFNEGPRSQDLSVAELIELSDSLIDTSNAYRMHLLRLGIRVDSDTITVASNHAGIAAILKGTPWTDWSRILRRLPGAAPTPSPVRFAGGNARGTTIPRAKILV